MRPPSTLLAPSLGRLAVVLAVALLAAATSVFAQTSARRRFDIPADDAARALKLFSEQSGRSLIADGELLRGVRTNAVKGDLSPLEAVNQMLAGTNLTAAADPQTGGFAIRPLRHARPPTARSDDGNGEAAPPVARPPVPVPAVDEVVSLSPFEVVANNRGYFGANTMSGTRLNTRLEDLGAAISVVTKEQMQDFAMLDLNDVFLYSAGTEGTGTYTDLVVDRNGQIFDNVQLNPTQANRVRGIAPANISLGNVETMGRVPVDPLAVDSIEISRGPNANVFGLGNPSGTVNMVPSSAHLQRSHSQVALRADSHDGFRTSVDFNRVLSKGRLALRGSAAFQRDGYVRKPSGTDTVRYNGMVKYQPFRFTTLTGSYSYYRMSGSRPNVTPPRDNVSYWIASGRPTWDPVAQVVHVDNRTLGPFSADAQVPDYFTRPGAFTQASHLYIDRSGVAYWSTASSNTGTTPTLSAQPIRLFETSPGAGSLTQGRFNAQPLFSTTRTVSDKSIYDWASVSLASANWLEDITHTYSVQWDQVIFHHPRHTLAAQLGFTREDAERFQRTPMGDAGISGSTGQLSIDVNERRLDGTANPFFLRPYVGVLLPLHKKRPALWDTTRAQVAYRLDLGKEKGWLRWLGQLQMTGYDEFKYRISRVYSFRDVLASDHPWLPAGTPRGASGAVTGGRPVGPAVLRAYYRYYVGDNAGANVDYGPSRYQNGPTSFVWGGYTLANNLPVAGSENFRMEPAVLGEAASTDGAGAGNNLKQIIKTRGAVAQHQLFDGRLVGTFGLRDDRSYTKFGNAPQLIGPDGMSFDYPTLDHWAAGDYRLSRGRTKTAGFVFRPFRDFRSGPESRTGLVGELLRGVSLTFNRSDNFIPAAPAQDLFLRPLPNPTGTGRDYGAWINLFNERLVVRVNRYENKQLNSRLGDANTIAERVTRLDVRNADPWQLEDQATAWVTATNPTWTQPQIRAEVARQIGMSQELQNVLEAPNPPLAATNDIVAKGTEIEINLNPSRYWTVAGSFTETRSINTRVSRTVDEYVAQRMPIWTTIRDQRDGQLWWTKNYGGVQTAAQNYAVNVETPYLIIKELEGKPRPQIRRYAARFSTHYQLAGITEHPQLKRVKIGGAVRWEDKAAIGFYGRQQLPATITALDSSRPIWDRSRAYFDAFASYRLRLWADRIGATVQLNVRNLQEGGRLQPIGAFPDGTPYAFRIVDPRQFIVQLSLEL